MTTVRALDRGIILCHVCHLQTSIHDENTPCPRCKTRLHARKPQSITKTWLLLITAAILYIPANLLPIMTVNYLGMATPSTIMEGVITFINLGDWFVGGVVFTASILVPSMKLIGMFILLIYVQYGRLLPPKTCTIMFRLIEWIGRWSMLDIFVIAIMVALVNFGNLSTIEADWGALAFGSVVIITMFAAMSFDPRLIWDHIESNEGNK
ncbi:paraquat-inducible membrane protein A [Entomomonas moraniae]|uniref:Paraquat-inducible membrane protein A n=1 Tax=Entomomonas moraniae TaxID=2213226 RepID=A0A3Q9JKW6_9GAMM|nr:paraquat-inducible protein A [Entomomonas moraniae]AZS51879.1 paraquat-inducible membrane protein A [Entomomonas moraniae]